MLKLIPKHQKGLVIKKIKDVASDAAKGMVHAEKTAGRTGVGQFLSEDEIMDLYHSAKVIDTQNKVKFNMDEFQDLSKLPRQRQSWLGMEGVNSFLDYYMKKYPTKTYQKWWLDLQGTQPVGFRFGIDSDVRKALAIRNQMYYDLRDASLNYSPQKTQQLLEQAKQMNDIYKDLLNRQAIIRFVNNQPTLREDFDGPALFWDFMQQYKK